MPTLNETKEQMIVVGSVGEFTNALQQIATQRMMRLRTQVMKSRPFVETASDLLQELMSQRNAMQSEDMTKLKKRKPSGGVDRRAVIIVTSNQGLTGRYNIEIYQKVEKLLVEQKDADFFIVGKKGQEYFQGHKFKELKVYPYTVPDTFGVEDLSRLTSSFDYYDQVTLAYSRFINTATREVVVLSVVAPLAVSVATDTKKDAKVEETKEQAENGKEGKKEEPVKEGRYLYEPHIDQLIEGVSKTLRNALFQQQIMDARLAQNSSQMIGMKTASDNANALLGDLRMEYNKARRKMIDKKIGEVFAGSALW
ncbi:MAG: F0F1 ATP synthase subunit gamma [bacterium]